MTIVVGVLCKDGIVIAADTMMTAGEVGVNNRKLYNGNDFVCGIAGDDGLGKFLIHDLEKKQHRERFFSENGKDSYDKILEISLDVKKHFLKQNPEISSNINDCLVKGGYPAVPNLATIIGFASKNDFYLSSFQCYGHPRLIKPNDRIFYDVIGIGTKIANPLISLVSEILDIKVDNKPNLIDGRIFAYWLVKYTIDNSSGYVGGNVEMITLNTENNQVVSKKEDCSELQSAIEDLMKYIKKYQNTKNDIKVKLPNI